MAVEAILQVVNGDFKYKPFVKYFENEKEMCEWLTKQNEHPWLSMNLLEHFVLDN